MRDGEELYMNNCEIIMPFGSTSNGRAALHKPLPDIGNEEDDYKANENSEVNIKIQDKIDLLVYPNPANNSLSVLLNSYETMDVSYAIIDAQGKKLLFTKATTNNAITTLDVSNINTGLYLLQAIIDGQLIATQKISIIK